MYVGLGLVAKVDVLRFGSWDQSQLLDIGGWHEACSQLVISGASSLAVTPSSLLFGMLQSHHTYIKRYPNI